MKIKANIEAVEIWIWRITLFILSVIVLSNLLSGNLHI